MVSHFGGVTEAARINGGPQARVRTDVVLSRVSGNVTLTVLSARAGNTFGYGAPPSLGLLPHILSL